MALYVQNLSAEQKRKIHKLCANPEPDLPVKRLLLVLYSAEGISVPALAELVALHPKNVRNGCTALHPVGWTVYAIENHQGGPHGLVPSKESALRALPRLTRARLACLSRAGR